MDVPLPLAVLTFMPLIISLLLVPVGFLMPTCGCCDKCGQAVYQEVYVSYNASQSFAKSGSGGSVRYQNGEWGTFLFSPIDHFSVPGTLYVYFTNDPADIPSREGNASYGLPVSNSYSGSTSSTVTCINIGKTNSKFGVGNVLRDDWRYVFSELYHQAGCGASGVDVLVAPTCPIRDRQNRWTVTCYWCDGRSFSGGSVGSPIQPTSPQLPNSDQIGLPPVQLISINAFWRPPGQFNSVPLFDSTKVPSGYTAAIRKSDFDLFQEPTKPSVHNSQTFSDWSSDLNKSCVFLTAFVNPSLAAQTQAIGGNRLAVPDLPDALQTIANGGDDVYFYPNPCGAVSCADDEQGVEIPSQAFTNSSWATFTQTFNTTPRFYQYVQLPSDAAADGEAYMAVKELPSTVGHIVTDVFFGGGTYLVSGTITLEFPQ